MVHFEDKGMFPKVHWMIFEDSGRFLARIPRGLELLIALYNWGGGGGGKLRLFLTDVSPVFFAVGQKI